MIETRDSGKYVHILSTSLNETVEISVLLCSTLLKFCNKNK